MNINDSIKKVKRYPSAVEKITAETLKKNERVFAKMNVQQMEVGLRPDGSYQDYYSEVSIEKYGKEPGRIKLKETGEFHESVLQKTKAKKNVLTFTGDTQKEGTDLEKEFGPLFGLEENNLGKAVVVFRDDLYRGLKQYWT